MCFTYHQPLFLELPQPAVPAAGLEPGVYLNARDPDSAAAFKSSMQGLDWEIVDDCDEQLVCITQSVLHRSVSPILLDVVKLTACFHEAVLSAFLRAPSTWCNERAVL